MFTHEKQAGKRSATDGKVYLYVCSIPRECERNYFGETGRPLDVRFHEYRHNFRDGFLEKKLKLSLHACEKGHRVSWDNARISGIESSGRYRKYKESAHMAFLTNPISQPNLVISPIWIPLLGNEVTNSKRPL
jgi:hypothetical protein